MSNDRQLPSDIETYTAVESRNRLRKQSGLPPVELQQEMDRICQARQSRAFEQWMQSPLRYRVEQKLLTRLRRQRKNLTWKPTGFLSGGGWAFHVILVKQMRKLRVRLGERERTYS
jgi:hypothetical protein